MASWVDYHPPTTTPTDRRFFGPQALPLAVLAAAPVALAGAMAAPHPGPIVIIDRANLAAFLAAGARRDGEGGAG